MPISDNGVYDSSVKSLTESQCHEACSSDGYQSAPSREGGKGKVMTEEGGEVTEEGGGRVTEEGGVR